MANNFVRYAIPNGDDGVWATYEEAQNYTGNIGTCSAYMYVETTGFTLELMQGRIGIDNGTVEGTAIIDTQTSVSLVGTSNQTWIAIELAVSGTAVTISATDIAGATDVYNLPSTFLNAWDGDKQGYYLSATKRCIGIAWKDSGGFLTTVINVKNSEKGFQGLVNVGAYSPSEPFNHYIVECCRNYTKYKYFLKIGAWNMDTTVSVSVGTTLSISTVDDVAPITAIIENDAGTNGYNIVESDVNGADTPNGGIITAQVGGFLAFTLSRRTGGFFDSAASFSSVAKSRGLIYFERYSYEL